jgi:hypothetical protein
MRVLRHPSDSGCRIPRTGYSPPARLWRPNLTRMHAVSLANYPGSEKRQTVAGLTSASSMTRSTGTS